ncbi:Piso0_000697 [Millerozyma farinosa CBS 7064]|uniref:Piso0_000697 protein n=1 Tax=Pichia sorbitophila (strain ATCC MYA-4447 / BCRC 22081 / CBS 7064 / NBRC 10061 / NRRL Y-12695) TaxID=559304 RepID=G8YPT6_PICSO|nr:Piso0_000697 [Millerozyma farinosa CBS 7064]
MIILKSKIKSLSAKLGQNAVRSLSLYRRPETQVPYKTGQATHETRPHYIPKAGNLTPGISALEYYDRRMRLSTHLPARSLAIFVGNQVQYSSGSVFYDFQQDNNLYYMTGWLEPNSVAIVEKQADRGNEEDVLLHMLVPPKNEHAELWEGERSGLQGAYDYFNADYVEDINKVKSYLSNLLSRNDYVFWDDKSKGQPVTPASKVTSFFKFRNFNYDPSFTMDDLLRSSSKTVKPLSPIVEQMRSKKSEAEIKVMHAAGRISSRAINKAMGKVASREPIRSEKNLAKYLEYQFVKGGCDKQAYIPVVASGQNALTIHYTRNDDLLYQDELTFIDAGGKLGGYCSDISRAWPNSTAGFSGPQREIYEIVLNANKKCMDLCFERNNVSLNQIHEISIDLLTKEIRKLPGFSSISSYDLARDLYPHYIGHHLGLDLHDIPSVSKFKTIEEGNVLTIEPGLYIPFNDKYPKAYQGIGVRVEDNVVVGKNFEDSLNLTSLCAKEVADVEALVKNGVTTPGIDDELVILDIDDNII